MQRFKEISKVLYYLQNKLYNDSYFVLSILNSMPVLGTMAEALPMLRVSFFSPQHNPAHLL